MTGISERDQYNVEGIADALTGAAGKEAQAGTLHDVLLMMLRRQIADRKLSFTLEEYQAIIGVKHHLEIMVTPDTLTFELHLEGEVGRA